MAKKTAVKKPKRRLKKTVRRSMAAVLMITAVVVAAIPVPENAAAPGDDTPSEAAVAYEAARDPADFEENYAGEHSCKTSGVDCTAERLTADRELSPNLKKAVASGELIPAVKLYEVGGEKILGWEFLYHNTTSRASQLCKYNNQYPAEEVNIGLFLYRDYHTVTKAHYNEYFTNPGKYRSDEESEYNGENPMDNLTPNAATYPTDPMQYTYYDFNGTASPAMDTKVKKFFDTYFKQDYADQTALYEKYEADLAKWTADKAAYDRWDGNGTQPPHPGDRPEVPDPLVRIPAEHLSTEQKMDFYVEHNLALSGGKGTGYHLVDAVDARLDKNGNTVSDADKVGIYVAQGGTAGGTFTQNGYIWDNDKNGYLVGKDSLHEIATIGEEAFLGIENLGTITVSPVVRCIGDRAFEGSGIRSIVIENETVIGNRAFYGCGQLSSVRLGDTSGASSIGAEAFRSSGVTSITFPYSMKTVGYGAFSDCTKLTSVDFSKLTGECQLKAYAFFDDTVLNNVIFGDARVDALGRGCFAVGTPSTALPMTTFNFPKYLKSKMASDGQGKGLGEYVLANRQSLTTVTMSENYQAQVPSSTFYNCIGLKNVIFPDTCQAAEFDPDLFVYVTQTDFYVRGPELFGEGPAKPRSSTWYAKTRVSGENGVPYVYKDSTGKECYEVAMRSQEDGSLYRYEANEEGELLSCVLIDSKDNVDIIIPGQIGNYKIRSIGAGCFEDDTLRSKIRSITIRDDSINRISSEAFRGLSRLKKVRIGNSVTEIGDNAFADCRALYDVYFTKPAGGYTALSMSDSAFATQGAKLTFHGDIVEGYAPFEWATTKERLLKDSKDQNAPEVNVCYQSLWDSENGTHLTVMCDRGSDDVVLLDYPKLQDLDTSSLMGDEELRDYCSDMEQYYYYTVYDNNDYTVRSKGKTVQALRQGYALLWQATEAGQSSVMIDGVSVPTTQINDWYGPWVNPTYCEDWQTYIPKSAAAEKNGLYSFFFDPLVVQAARNPIPYYDVPANSYNFMKNYQNMQNAPSGEVLDDYLSVPERARRFIDGTETIIVPAGITSIDVAKYALPDGPNKDNYDTYISSAENDIRYRSKTGNTVPGLFSGRYQDYEDRNDERETDIRGNDLVKRIVLTSVKELPDNAFDSCEQLLSVELGAVSKIGLLPFRGCGNMISVVGNQNFPAEKGILFEKLSGDNAGKYKIIECLMSKGRIGTNDEGLEEKDINLGTISLLRDVESIADNAFEGCDNIAIADFTGVNSLKEIPTGCFKDCTGLNDVMLPVSINKIYEGAFDGVTQESGHALDVTIRGREVDIADSAFVPKSNVTIYSYADSAAERYALRFRKDGMLFKVLGSYRVKFYDYDGKQIGATQELEKTGNEDLFAKEPAEAQELYATNHRPGYKFTGEWRFYTSDGDMKTLKDPITEDMTTFIAQYESDGSTVGGRYLVEFHDGVDGSLVSGRGSNADDGKYYVDAGMSFKDLNMSAPTHKNQVGYEAFGYSDEFAEDLPITRNMSVILLYRAVSGGNTSGGTTNTSGGTTNTSRNTTSGNSGNTSGNSSNTSNNSSNSSSSNTSSTSTSSTSATSGTSGPGQFTVFVENGSGSGTYTPGTTVIISASIPAAGMRFDKWTTESNGVTLASVSMASTTFTMPSNNVTVKANYVTDTSAAPSAAGTGNTANTTGNGNTRVDIEKPGISNRDLATATTNGSTDNFIVKISETDEATRAVAAALTNKYGTLDNILYYAMDISLYDSTGTTKITDTTGLSVDITIPIPDSLVAYGGNNMAGAVISGDQLESLNESFTTINGVPCIRFRATHFSPYTIYVDTGNLVEGMLDVTPKTGDPIHPKWFLSLGLACLSMILFLKRDKRAAVKA